MYLKNEKTDKRLFISGAVQIDDLIPSRQEGGKVHQTDKTKKKFWINVKNFSVLGGAGLNKIDHRTQNKWN